jgi:hypothetical protein
MPLPVRVIAGGLPAPPLMFSVTFSAPCTDGMKVTLTVQFVPAAK